MSPSVHRVSSESSKTFAATDYDPGLLPDSVDRIYGLTSIEKKKKKKGLADGLRRVALT